MSLGILITPDKFKGTLTAHAAAGLIAEGWRAVRPDDRLVMLPMSDGGDGFGEVLARVLNVEARVIESVNAAHQPCECTWWLAKGDQMAIVESAKAVGLALVPPGRYHPFELDTYGLGPLVRSAMEESGHLLVGIGGSATNDGGFGVARSLDWSFVSTSGGPVVRWTDLVDLGHVIPPKRMTEFSEVQVAVDVQNPLLGPTGASRIYGPQKGLRPADFPLAEACLGRLAEVVKSDLGLDASSEPGTGAAGGLGFGLRCFMNARLESGFGLFARYARLEERIANANMVISGEGSIDASTLMGKGVGEIARLCRRHNVPCLGLAGTLGAVGTGDSRSESFTKLYGIAPELTTVEAAKANPEVWLPRLAAKAAREWA
jgi:glycerate kinase